MAASIFDLSGNPELRTLLEVQMRRQQWRENTFAQWIGPEFVKKMGGTEEVPANGPQGGGWTGAPIETVTAFIEKGRTDMLIPVRNRLTGLPVFGNMQLKGTAEAAAFAFRLLEINRTRKAYAPPTGMEEQKTRQWATSLVMEAKSYLSTWLNDYFPSSLLLAFYAGYSRDIVMPVTAGGLGQAYVSHPNFFVAGSGQVGGAGGAYVGGRPGTAGYEAAVEAALNGLNGAAGQACTVALITNLVFEAARLKIPRITTKDGFKFYAVWLKDAQWNQLQADTAFQALAKSLFISKLSEHPLGNGMVAFISGAAIYVDFNLFCAYTNADDANVTAGTVEYGPRPTAAQRAAGFKLGNTMLNLDTGNKAVGILVGQSCLSVGTGKKLVFTEQTDDHGNVQEIGIEMIQSIVRNETYDRLGLIPGLTKGDFYENTSSLVFATWSPFALTYT